MEAVHEAVDVVEGQESKDDKILLLDDFGIVAHDLDQVRSNVAVGQHHSLTLACYFHIKVEEFEAAPAPAGRKMKAQVSSCTWIRVHFSINHAHRQSDRMQSNTKVKQDMTTQMGVTGGSRRVAEIGNLIHIDLDGSSEALGKDGLVGLVASFVLATKEEDVFTLDAADLGCLEGGREEINGGDHVRGTRVLELVDDLLESVRVVDSCHNTSCAQCSKNWHSKVVLLVLWKHVFVSLFSKEKEG